MGLFSVLGTNDCLQSDLWPPWWPLGAWQPWSSSPSELHSHFPTTPFCTCQVCVQPGLIGAPSRHKEVLGIRAQGVPGSSRGSQVGPAPTSRRVLHHLCQVGALSKDGVVIILIRKKDKQQVKILREAQWEDRL